MKVTQKEAYEKEKALNSDPCSRACTELLEMWISGDKFEMVVEILAGYCKERKKILGKTHR